MTWSMKGYGRLGIHTRSLSILVLRSMRSDLDEHIYRGTNILGPCALRATGKEVNWQYNQEAR